MDSGTATRPPIRRESLPPVPRQRAQVGLDDAAQRFVARLRGCAADFASAAGAQSAVVPEAVPPARHRRARCRVVLRFADGSESDLTFLGAAGRVPSTSEPSSAGFDVQIRGWLVTGRRRDPAWLVPDPAAVDGVAVDLTAWLAGD